MISSRKALAAGTCAFALLYVGRADAVVTTYSGTRCMREFALSQASIWYSGARATSLGAPNYVCSADQRGGRLLSARVFGKDVNPAAGAQVSCFAVVKGPWDNAGVFTPTLSSPDGQFTLDLGGLPAPGFLSPGIKEIHCTMPSAMVDGSWISAYSITEG